MNGIEGRGVFDGARPAPRGAGDGRRSRRAPVGIGLLALGLALSSAAVTSVSAQEPTTQRALPADLRPACERVGIRPGTLASSASDEDREEAGRLAEEASRAAILGDRSRARSLLEQAARLDPGSGEIAYRLGRILEGADASREAVQHYCRFVALDPDGSEVDEVRGRILQLSPTPVESRPAASRAAFNPTAALVTGLVLPGSGHIYSDRPGSGILIFLAAGGSAVAGAMYTRTEVECLVDPGSNECPEEMIVGVEKSRPFLAHGIAAAGAITLFSAVHAAVTVRRGNGSGPGALAVTLPVPGRDPDAARPVLTLDPVAAGGGGLRATVRFAVP